MIQNKGFITINEVLRQLNLPLCLPRSNLRITLKQNAFQTTVLFELDFNTK